MEQKEKISVERLINTIIALVGVILVVIGVILSAKEKASTILISVGASLIASSMRVDFPHRLTPGSVTI